MECSFNTLWIYTALKLNANIWHWAGVSIPSEFTLLSNFGEIPEWNYSVSIPSEFTLLSNNIYYILGKGTVSIPSEFTLLSNRHSGNLWFFLFQYPLNLHCSQTEPIPHTLIVCFNTLWIYTALKHKLWFVQESESFNTLWIYTALKPQTSNILVQVSFNTLWIYTALKL